MWYSPVDEPTWGQLSMAVPHVQVSDLAQPSDSLQVSTFQAQPVQLELEQT